MTTSSSVRSAAGPNEYNRIASTFDSIEDRNSNWWRGSVKRLIKPIKPINFFITYKKYKTNKEGELL
jgi:hypothetical protein